MRAIPLTVTALAALLLTACNDGSSDKSATKDSSACRLGGVSVQVGAASMAPAAGDTGEVPVSITNQSTPCVLDHFPDVTLAQKGVSAKLPAQKEAKARKLKLAKGDSATFTITYVRGKTGDATSLAAPDMRITLPGDDTAQSFTWKYGPVAGQGSQGKPNATVSAFQQVGD